MLRIGNKVKCIITDEEDEFGDGPIPGWIGTIVSYTDEETHCYGIQWEVDIETGKGQELHELQGEANNYTGWWCSPEMIQEIKMKWSERYK